MMASTEINIGLTSSTRPSSRVLKPPGGGHSNIFAEPEVAVNAPRPKYNQQNSSNLNACMNSVDPNEAVEKLRTEISTHPDKGDAMKSKGDGESAGSTTENANKSNGGGSANGTNGGGESSQSSRGRVPPGGYSSGGFW